MKERLAHLEALHGGAMKDPGAMDTANLELGLHQSAAAGLIPVEGPDALALDFLPVELPGKGQGVGVPEEDTASALDTWDPIVHIDPFLAHRSRCHDTTVAAAATAAPFNKAPLVCGCGHTHAALVKTRGPRGSESRPIVMVDLGRCRAGRDDSTAANPYANHLRVETLCTIAALHEAGAPLGVAPEQACARDTPSPFERPGASAAARAAAARLFDSLPRDLRPSAAQIARPHPPVIDMLPFPMLRCNLLAGGAGGVDSFPEAFFVDLLVGLVCWAGVGSARPWEARAWEARPWFLHKYWALLGGEAGELVRMSAWWRTARGDFTGLVGA